MQLTIIYNLDLDHAAPENVVEASAEVSPLTPTFVEVGANIQKAFITYHTRFTIEYLLLVFSTYSPYCYRRRKAPLVQLLPNLQELSNPVLQFLGLYPLHHYGCIIICITP